MVLHGERVILRPWQPGDEPALVRHGGDRDVWRNLTDRFPHPYTHEEAVRWIAVARDEVPDGGALAIELDGEAVGGVGFERKEDLARLSAEVGYWLGRSVWGRGLATEAVRLLSAHAFATRDLERLQATVLVWNPASARVLEKCGYAREARLRRAAAKDGEVVDTWLYARLRGDPDGGEAA